MKLFVDTWGWLTLYDKREIKHKEVSTFWKQFRIGGGVLYTTDYILAETYTLLFKRLDSHRAKNAMQELGIDWVLTQDTHFAHVGMGFQLKP